MKLIAPSILSADFTTLGDEIRNVEAAGADWISVHAETCPHLNRTIDLIKSSDCRAGVVLNPATSLSTIEWVIEYIDFVLLMSVNPGFGGQSFISNTIEKTKQLKQMIDKKDLSTLIQIDGGVNEKTIYTISEAGADVFVAGSAIFGTGDYKKTIKNLKNKLSDPS